MAQESDATTVEAEREAYLDAQQKYQGYRNACYEIAWETWRKEVPGDVDLRLFPIDERAVQFAEMIWPRFSLEGFSADFPWSRIYQQIRSTPRRFDISIWDGAILCGLAAGTSSRGQEGCDTNVTIRFLERMGGDINRLAGFIAAICLDAADAYAQVLGKRMIYLKNPSPMAIRRYECLGFSLVDRRAQGIYYGVEAGRNASCGP